MFLVIFDEEFYSHLSCVTLLKRKRKYKAYSEQKRYKQPKYLPPEKITGSPSFT